MPDTRNQGDRLVGYAFAAYARFNIKISGVYSFCVSSYSSSTLYLDGMSISTYQGQDCTSRVMRTGTHLVYVEGFFYSWSDTPTTLRYSGPDTDGQAVLISHCRQADVSTTSPWRYECSSGIMSHGPYSSSDSMEAMIAPPYATGIILSFTAFKTRLSLDTLTIYECPAIYDCSEDSRRELLPQHSGPSIPSPLNSSTGVVLLVWRSGTAAGNAQYNWTAQWSATFYYPGCNPNSATAFDTHDKRTSFTLCSFNSNSWLSSVPTMGTASQSDSGLNFKGKTMVPVVELYDLTFFKTLLPDTSQWNFASAIYGSIIIQRSGAPLSSPLPFLLLQH